MFRITLQAIIAIEIYKEIFYKEKFQLLEQLEKSAEVLVCEFQGKLCVCMRLERGWKKVRVWKNSQRFFLALPNTFFSFSPHRFESTWFSFDILDGAASPYLGLKVRNKLENSSNTFANKGRIIVHFFVYCPVCIEQRASHRW